MVITPLDLIFSSVSFACANAWVLISRAEAMSAILNFIEISKGWVSSERLTIGSNLGYIVNTFNLLAFYFS